MRTHGFYRGHRPGRCASRALIPFIRLRLALGLTTLLCLAASANAQTPDPAQTLRLGPGHSEVVSAFSNVPLTAAALHDVTRLVVIVPDRHLSAQDALQALQQAPGEDSNAMTDTAIVAPRFPDPYDPVPHGSLVWNHDQWSIGLASNRPEEASSFDVMDHLLQWLAQPARTPALAHIVVVGVGLGAEYVQRYAVFGDVGPPLAQRRVSMRYVVINAPSYLYLSNARPHDPYGYAPYSRGICPTYDDYRYGLQRRPAYLGGDTHALTQRYLGREVIYLLGDQLTNPEMPGLDTGCGAEAQGATTLARGVSYLGYIQSLSSHYRVLSTQAGYSVVGVADDPSMLLGSSCGVSAVFGTQSGMPGEGMALCHAVSALTP